MTTPMQAPIRRAILEQQGGPAANMFGWLIAAAGQATAPVKHRLYWRFCNQLSGLMPEREYSMVVQLWEDSRFRLFLDDPYWSRLVATTYEYEPDFEHALARLNGLDFDFLDCGANFGYWSIFLSSGKMDRRKVIAVEASPATYRILQENCRLNDNRFACVNYAVSATSGEQVCMEANSGHAGAHIVSGEGAAAESLVTTRTLDDLVREQYAGQWPARLLIKLDVEGQEVNALNSASELLQQSDVAFYYEDHGNDPTSAVTGHVLEQMGLNVLFAHDDGSVVPIESVEAASRLKTRKTVGYNFWACKADSAFLQRLTQG